MTIAILERPKKCVHCGGPFFPARPLQRVCSPICASRLVKTAKKEQRDRDKSRKEKAKTPAKWRDEAQAIVNRYVRLRDRNLPCCSCDRPATWDGQWHASHFRSVGAASAVRFHLWNIHKGCSICNNHKSGNLEGYRPRIIERIGADRVDWLMNQNQLVRYDVDYLKRLKAVIGKRLKRLEARL